MTSKRPRGRPPGQFPVGEQQMVHVRLPVEMIDEVDQTGKEDATVYSRNETIRQLIREALAARKGRRRT